MKIIPIRNYQSFPYVLVMGDYSTDVFRKRNGYWEAPFYSFEDNIEPDEVEFLISRQGMVSIYNNLNDTLSYYLPYGQYVGVPCAAKPIYDRLGNIHVIWASPGDTSHDIYYGFSIDTLATFEASDTLPSPPSFITLASSPNDSIVAALFFDQQSNSLLKYIAADDQAIDFSAVPESANCDNWINGPYDMTIDNRGKIYSVNYKYRADSWGIHCAWSEDYGYSFLNESLDEVLMTPAFEIAFGPNEGEVLIIENGNPPNGHYQAGYFVTTDGGSSWYQSTYSRPFGYNVYYGSTPRSYNDTIEIVYYSGEPDNGVYYYPVLRDSIFNQLTAIGGEEAPVPADISLSNYPNPFNSRTNIVFDLPTTSDIELSVFDITGSKVAVLASGRVEAGSHSITWDGYNKAGHPVSSGIYFYKISINGNHRASKSMLLLK